MEQLIVKYLEKRLSRREMKELKHWLDSDPKHLQVFENIVGAWTINADQVKRSKGKVWSQISSSEKQAYMIVAPESQHEMQEDQFNHFGLRWGKVAAVVLVILSASLAFFFKDRIFYTPEKPAQQEVMVVKTAGKGEKLTVTLGDGTRVKMNSGSRITYKKAFSGNIREVTLEGEAYFDVAHDQSRPFRVFSKGVIVEVLGTAFNVKNDVNGNKVEVAVQRGSVKVTPQRIRQSEVLRPHEMLTYDAIKGSAVREDILDERLVFGWVDNQLIFRNNDLAEVCGILERWYNVNVENKSQTMNAGSFSGVYDNPSLENVLHSLAYAYDFKFKIDQHVVTIY